LQGKMIFTVACFNVSQEAKRPEGSKRSLNLEYTKHANDRLTTRCETK